MESGPVIMIVGTECPPESEEEFNNWYSEKHVPGVLKFKGAKKATRYKLAPIRLTDHKLVPITEGEYPKYLAIYEFENRQAAEAYNTSPEFAANVEDWVNNWAKRGAKLKWRVHYEPIKTWQK